MAISTFIFLCCLLGISSFVDSFNICLRGINQVHHRWHTILLSTSSIERTSVVAIETTEIIAKRKSTKKKNLSAKERTGYEYVENGVEFDVPVISTPKW